MTDLVPFRSNMLLLITCRDLSFELGQRLKKGRLKSTEAVVKSSVVGHDKADAVARNAGV